MRGNPLQTDQFESKEEEWGNREGVDKKKRRAFERGRN